MTEAELLSAVTEMADKRKLLWHHCTDARRCTGHRGLPDLVLAGEYGVIFAELKTDDGETSAQQDRWGWTLDRAAGDGDGRRITYLVWRPAELTYGVTIASWLDLIALGVHR